ncbi:hypothetical protein F3J24_10155 [Comamonas sp. Tr-654]|uniref:hypothetical protein n=1 Tax=Comamonas sp. Tr-654 TaxID=2608341 RepID=UPI00142416A9|nr:hypothetical protein [Comamonas sp. Tr-654]NIF83858.1 hypothetical protein [Comamonas sp. Tr-654]
MNCREIVAEKESMKTSGLHDFPLVPGVVKRDPGGLQFQNLWPLAWAATRWPAAEQPFRPAGESELAAVLTSGANQSVAAIELSKILHIVGCKAFQAHTMQASSQPGADPAHKRFS